ncbi:alpha/beta fold hydrolase [Sinorhizobium meliloti]|uniref:alpha/beta fold hydrolase n=1 Tax=Rhizobium meliloti TaxID=382 RepID=UPI003F170A3F
MEGQALPAGTAIADVAVTFGPFSLYPGRHVLLKEGEPLSIGSRALEILIALVEQAGELVSKDDLTARAWPNAAVEESNLRAQIALLRKVLGDDQTAPRYVVSVPSRGYRFVAPVTRMPLEPAAGELVDNNLPKQLTQVIGREEAIKIVEGRFQRFRIVTIVGPGGMGKTTVGIRVAAQLLSSHKDGICFLDLAPITNPQLLPSILASALRLTETSDDPTRSLIGFLRGKRMLIVFDSCEHILEDAARLAETLLREAPEVAILATSREALRVEGESVYRLPPLDMPPSAVVLTADDALKYPAIRLFVERAASSGSGYSFDDDEAPVVAHICRQLEGIALAIELAAARVEAFGTRGIAELLNDRLLLLTGGRRTALPRHQTLAAMIEWSYGALSAREQTVARHGKGRVAKAVLISAIPPVMVKSAKNPGGLPIEVFDGYRAALAANRAQLYLDIASGPFYGFNRPGAAISEGTIRNWWRQGMMGGANAHYECIKVFSETDFTEDLQVIDVPVLVMHGSDDQVLPIADSAELSVKLLKDGKLKVYDGYPHGMFTTHADVINADLLAFIKA